MNRVENQLNKAKNNSKSTSKTLEIGPKAVRELLEIINAEIKSSYSDLAIATFNSPNGRLTCGVGLMLPKYLISVVEEANSECLRENLSIFQIPCDLIQTTELNLKCDCIDVAVVGPQLDKQKKTDLTKICNALELAKIVFCCFEADQASVLLKRFPNASTIGTIQIDMPLSLHYERGNQNIKTFTVFKLKR
jgi:hypothetical protein